MALIPPNYFNSVVAIGDRNDNRSIKWVGTGCLIGRFFRSVSSTNRQYHIFIVTNKHVIEGRSSLVVRFNPFGESQSMDFDLPLTDGSSQPLWEEHPEIDVAVIGLNAEVLEQQNINYQYFRSDFDTMNLEKMSQSGVSEGDFIYVLGFPMGIVDPDRQYVIARSGIIARIRDALEKQRDDFLIDASVFPGNSGGPVIYKPEIISIQGTRSITQPGLIGIVSCYLSYKDTAVSQQTGSVRVVFEENSGLAVVIPVDFILETIDICFSKRNIKENQPTEPQIAI